MRRGTKLTCTAWVASEGIGRPLAPPRGSLCLAPVLRSLLLALLWCELLPLGTLRLKVVSLRGTQPLTQPSILLTSILFVVDCQSAHQ